MILLNKWELLDADERPRVTPEVERKLHFIGEAPVLKMSALTGKGVHKLAAGAGRRDRVVPHPHPDPEGERRHPRRADRAARAARRRVMYALQGAADPPTFTLFANKELPPTYLRYLERRLREAFDLGATPIKLRVRNRRLTGRV